MSRYFLNMMMALLKARSIYTLILTLSMGFSSTIWAHNGEVHEHEEPVKMTISQAAPRFAVQGENIELVGVWHETSLVLYLDNKNDNSPITDASLEIQSEVINGIAKPTVDGTYTMTTKALSAGKYPLTISVESPQYSDLLIAELQILPETTQTTKATAKTSTLNAWYSLILLVPVLLFCLSYWRKKGDHHA